MADSASGPADAGSRRQTHWRRRAIVSFRQGQVPSGQEPEPPLIFQFRRFMGAEEDTALGQQNLFRFLSYIDAYLQEHTLGVSEALPQKPSVTNHRFRSLKSFEFAVKEDKEDGNDYATGAAHAP